MPNRAIARAAQTAVQSVVLEDLECRRLNSATAYDIGINMNDGASATVAKVVPYLKSLGVKTLRLWTSVSDFNDRTMTGVMQRAIDYSNAGFDITLEVANKNGFVPTAGSVKGWFQWATSNTALKAAVDRWEIGNEPDHSEYWQGSLSSYVTTYLKPAYEALHAAGETVVSAGPSWSVADVKTMIDAGMLSYTDYVGFHPYASGVAGVTKSVAAIDALVAGRKPIAFTEWNVRGLEGNKTAWAAAIAAVYPVIKAGSDLNYYFAMRVQNSMAGPAGIFTTSYALNQPFYNAFATFAGAGVTTPVTGGNDSDNDGGNTSSGSGTISGTLFNDDDADGVFDSGESATGARVVYIDANANGQLDSGEKSTTASGSGKYSFTGLSKGTYKVARVFPDGFGLSNNSLGYVQVSIAVGQTLSGVNLGSTYADSTGGNSGSGGNSGTGDSDTTPEVTAFQIYDASTQKLISAYDEITGNVTIKKSALPAKVAVVAVADEDTDSMELTAMGFTQVKNDVPYAFFSDYAGTLKGVALSTGSYTLTATAYGDNNATGTEGTTLTATVKIV